MCNQNHTNTNTEIVGSYPMVSFITPTFNSELWIDNYLISIKKQDYPKEKIEIIFIDGGSTDNTIEIAKEKNIKVIENELILGDPGFAVGAEHATGDFMVFMGHDNELGDKLWINNMIRPLVEDESIIAAYPHLENKDDDTWLTKYVNKFTDPGNHFVYEYANNPLTFNKAYKIIKKTKEWEVYDFTSHNHPILEFEQGLMVRKKDYYRDKETFYCGILAIINLINDGKKFAYVPDAYNYHATLNGGLWQFIKKHRWAIDYNLDKRETFGIYKKSFGLKARNKYISKSRKARMYLYPFYGISFIIPCIRALFMLLKGEEKEWIYHPFITFISASIIGIEVIRIKLLRMKPVIDRY